MEQGRSLKRWSLALLVVGFACLVAARLIGSQVAADGIRQEPFALIPIGWFSLSLGLILGAVHVFGRLSGRGDPAPPDPD